jgi:hypothetical protein
MDHFKNDSSFRAAGQCLCAAVRFIVHGPLRDVIVCHCRDCRRWHGHVFAATAVKRDDLAVIQTGTLRWFTVPGDQPLPLRGFCSNCGSSLFWDAPERETISIAAGTLNSPTGLRTVAHIFTACAGDYEVLLDDGLPHHSHAAPSDLLKESFT